MEGGDANVTATSSDVLGSQHGGVRGRLVTIGLDLHSTYAIRGNQYLSQKSLDEINAPVTREMVSLPDRSVMWTKVSLKEAKM